MKKQLDKIDKNAEMLMGRNEISSSARQQLQTAVKVCGSYLVTIAIYSLLLLYLVACLPYLVISNIAMY